MKKPPAKPATTERPPATKHPTERFDLGSVTRVDDSRVIHVGRLWSKEVRG